MGALLFIHFVATKNKTFKFIHVQINIKNNIY